MNGTDAADNTSTKEKKADQKSKPKKEKPAEVKESTVKVNLTADMTILDLPEASTTVSICLSTSKL